MGTKDGGKTVEGAMSRREKGAGDTLQILMDPAGEWETQELAEEAAQRIIGKAKRLANTGPFRQEWVVNEEYHVVDTGEDYALYMDAVMSLPMETLKGMKWWEVDSMAKGICRSLDWSTRGLGRSSQSGGATYEPRQDSPWTIMRLGVVAGLIGGGIVGLGVIAGRLGW